MGYCGGDGHRRPGLPDSAIPVEEGDTPAGDPRFPHPFDLTWHEGVGCVKHLHERRCFTHWCRLCQWLGQVADEQAGRAHAERQERGAQR